MVDVDGKLGFQRNVSGYLEEGAGIALGSFCNLEVLRRLKSEVVVLVG